MYHLKIIYKFAINYICVTLITTRMKKVFTTLVVMAAATVTAAAAQPEMVKFSGAVNNTLQKQAEISLVKKAAPAKVAPAKISAVSDIYGPHEWTGIGQLSSNGGKTVTTSANFSEGSTPTEVTFTFASAPYSSNVPIPATVDVAKSTVTFKQATLAFNDKYSTPETFVLYRIVEGADGKGQLNQLESVEATIAENGDIVFPEDIAVGIGLQGEDGWFWLTSNNVVKAYQFFKYDAAEWQPYAKATFFDGWINPVLKEEYRGSYDVNVLQHKDKKGLFLVENPYGAGTPYVAGGSLEGLNATPSDNGYIVLDAEVPGCVVVNTLVYSGLTLDQSENGDGSVLEKFYNYNLEAFYMTQGFSKEEIIDEFDYNGQPISTYDEAKGLITIKNPVFGMGANPMGTYTWQSGMLDATFQFDLAGVEGVEMDANAPAKYYNLQGMEVKAPAAGELVIVKKGGKTYKTFAK